MRPVALVWTACLIVACPSALGWICPACSTESEGLLCTDCGLPRPPEGMGYAPACTVEVRGAAVRVESFFVDSFPVTYREILPWMNENVSTLEDMAGIVTGQYDANLQFLRYTPFTGNSEGTGITVPSNCFSLPVGSFTYEGAASYLQSRGARLPTTAEILAAKRQGLVDRFDVESVMRRFAAMMRSTMGSMLGDLANQAMFAGYSTVDERLMWEWTTDAWRQPPDSIYRLDAPYRVIVRPTEEAELGAAGSDMGYFNVTFRGVVPILTGEGQDRPEGG
ncbi:SUMF1/EgtB/PvdO family nonheme iron enzyme [Candidatus Fermentibacteria bacterium]|nr:SUMF1/EgtB/PvdO family nonheme iron enzyme [Candidatus Fermentibacteria bacterium]